MSSKTTRSRQLEAEKTWIELLPPTWEYELLDHTMFPTFSWVASSDSAWNFSRRTFCHARKMANTSLTVLHTTHGKRTRETRTSEKGELPVWWWSSLTLSLSLLLLTSKIVICSFTYSRWHSLSTCIDPFWVPLLLLATIQCTDRFYNWRFLYIHYHLHQATVRFFHPNISLF